MRFLNKALLICVGAFATASLSSAFVVSPSKSTALGTASRDRWSSLQATAEEDCGCGGNVIFQGKPTDRAKNLDARQVLSQHSVQNALGETIPMDNLLHGKNPEDGVSIAVFLRSLG